ncbi:hypothetical protein E4P40_03275 [Blastococcus sp. CT_GayMR20]|uniref:hypothetical protein n=1 Tax=Blastococcus sp. CT_GayMR20 TaxID=2559609 RepID=UPI0010730376|nr:hypothetical protein [Blastococcus sp. CT_GayMR20]TFV92235.1 hypothetical protein E4P40_03275 [Blastococcus sp. CT_GayMR20]
MGRESQGDIGIVLVHGIGEKTHGETLDKFLNGLTGSVSDAGLTSRQRGHAAVSVSGRTFRVYEAWWADVLTPDAVQGTFDAFTATEITWFPWLNWRQGLYADKPGVKVMIWTVVLRPIMVVLPVLIMLVGVVFRRLPRVLEQEAGDVTNYLNSAGLALPDDSKLRDVSDRVMSRFAAALESAARDGCSRVIVVGHSLGSVVAYHGLTGHVQQTPARRRAFLSSGPARSLVTNLITIGSPLEKIRFFWPLLVATGSHRLPSGICWDNIRDRLDLVAGKLRHADSFGPVHDHALAGRAWLLTAHTAYERNPYFMRLLLDRSGVTDVEVKRTTIPTRLLLGLKSVLLTLAAIAVLVVPFGITLVVIALFVFITIVIGAFEVAAESGASGVEFDDRLGLALGWSLWLTPVAFFLGTLSWGYGDATTRISAFRHRQWPVHDEHDPPNGQA